MLIEKTNITVDLENLRKDFLDNKNHWPCYQNRYCLNNYNNNDDYLKNAQQRLIYTEYKYMNSIFKNTIWEDVLKKIPVKISRARIMMMPPTTILSIHRDIEPRWHLALFTDPGCIYYDVDTSTAVHIPSDGHFYRLDTRFPHTAFNATDNFTRIHLVVCEHV
jgi:aspartyl/asparaginyl beta-hydroxylase (cupin superfamily)